MQAHEPRAIELLRGAGRSADRGCGDRREDRRHLRRVPALRLSARHRPAPSRRPSGQPKAMRLMREHDLTVRPRRRWVATTDSNHDGPIFPNLAKGLLPTAPNELWVADITYIAIATGFVYLAVILDAWSRRVVGYAIGRSIDVRLTMAALRAAIEVRRPPPGCIHHSDRGSQYAADK